MNRTCNTLRNIVGYTKLFFPSKPPPVVVWQVTTHKLTAEYLIKFWMLLRESWASPYSKDFHNPLDFAIRTTKSKLDDTNNTNQLYVCGATPSQNDYRVT